MPHHHQTFELAPHPTSHRGAVARITGRIRRERDRLLVNWRLEGELSQLRIPPPATPRAVDELWRHTCFELFIATQGDSGYLEFNFSPSGEWAAYGFRRYRERTVFAAGAEPLLAVRRSAARLELDAVAALPDGPGFRDAPLAAGLSSVIEAADGTLSYWALAHPAERPDFHHPEAFALRLHEIRH